MAKKLSELTADIRTAARNSREALGEINARLAQLQDRIDDLIESQSDPEVTDAEMLADLEALKADTQALADIVPNVPPVEPTDPTVPTEPTPTAPQPGNEGTESGLPPEVIVDVPTSADPKPLTPLDPGQVIPSNATIRSTSRSIRT